MEIGCAGGGVINSLLQLGVREQNIYGIDIRPEGVEDAKMAFPNVNFTVMDARQLEFPDSNFDVVTIFTLLSSILEYKIRKKIASEIERVLKPGGMVIYYDFRYNNPFNPNVMGIRKTEIKKLFPRMNRELKLITLLPPLARRLGGWTKLYILLFLLFPCLRSHYLGLFIKEY